MFKHHVWKSMVQGWVHCSNCPAGDGDCDDIGPPGMGWMAPECIEVDDGELFYIMFMQPESYKGYKHDG